MKKHVWNVKKCYKNFKIITKIRKHKKERYQNNHTTKRYPEEFTDESGNLNYKSRYKNKIEESLSRFKLIKRF